MRSTVTESPEAMPLWRSILIGTAGAFPIQTPAHFRTTAPGTSAVERRKFLLNQRDRNRRSRRFVDDAEFHFVIRLVRANEHGKLFRIDDQLIVNLGEHVEFLEPRLGSRAVGHDFV